MFGFGGGVSFDLDKDIPDLDGKVILVTGANYRQGNSGLGAESIKQLAKHNPAELWLAARNLKTAEAVLAEVKHSTPSAKITILELDLSSLESVKAAAITFVASAKRLDILLLNAGIAFNPPGTTKEGYEIQFGTNHVGHALLAQMLLPLLLETSGDADSDVRIVIVSSAGHNLARAGLNLEVLKSENLEQSTLGRYGVSKLANIYFTQELAARYPAIRSIAVHPGTVPTPIFQHILSQYPWAVWPFKFISAIFLVTVETGVKNQLWASVAAAATSGAYYDPVGKSPSVSHYVDDKDAAVKLWEWTQTELEAHGSSGWP